MVARLQLGISCCDDAKCSGGTRSEIKEMLEDKSVQDFLEYLHRNEVIEHIDWDKALAVPVEEDQE